MYSKPDFIVFFKKIIAKTRMNNARTATILIASSMLLMACSGGSNRPRPADLGANPALVGVRQAWTLRVPAQVPGAAPAVVGNALALASLDGSVTVLDATSGREVWRGVAGSALATGAGFDGKVAAVVTQTNELVALDAGREIWRSKITTQAYTAPFVAGGRVFVLAADRSVTAFDGATGRKLWVQQRQSEPLVLRHGGTLLAVADTLVVGLAGRMVGLNPATGVVRWEAPVASPRGTNDVERLVDMVGRVSRVGDVVCARAYQASVGCVNANRGTLLWARPANGAEGVHGDDRLVFGTELDGKVIAWRKTDGERAWTSERLQHRGLSAPLVVGRSVVIGDDGGVVHLLSREDGSALARLTTDSSGISAGPVLAGDTLVVTTRNGGVYGFAPE